MLKNPLCYIIEVFKEARFFRTKVSLLEMLRKRSSNKAADVPIESPKRLRLG